MNGDVRTAAGGMAPLVVVSLLIALLVWSWSLSQTPRYESTATMMVGQRPPPSDCAHGICLLPNAPPETFTRNVAKAVTTTSVAAHATDRLNLPEGSVEKVLENTSARADPGAPFVDVTYTSTNPKTAQVMANALVRGVSETASEGSLDRGRLTADLWSKAELPDAPVRPKPLRNGLIALALALTLSAGLLAGRRALVRGSQLW